MSKTKTKKDVREFSTGATRDNEDGKLDFEGFLSPIVLERFGQYMHQHRKQSNGQMRDSDNWQLGIPVVTYRKSLVRHLFQAWGVWRGYKVFDNKGVRVELVDALLAVVFNALGYLHELLKTQQHGKK